MIWNETTAIVSVLKKANNWTLHRNVCLSLKLTTVFSHTHTHRYTLTQTLHILLDMKHPNSHYPVRIQPHFAIASFLLNRKRHSNIKIKESSIMIGAEYILLMSGMNKNQNGVTLPKQFSLPRKWKIVSIDGTGCWILHVICSWQMMTNMGKHSLIH